MSGDGMSGAGRGGDGMSGAGRGGDGEAGQQPAPWLRRPLKEAIAISAAAQRRGGGAVNLAPSRIYPFLQAVQRALPPGGAPATPLLASWEVTRACNLACSHCFLAGRAGPVSPALPTSAALSLIDQMADLGILQVTLTGGEPLLRSDLPHLLGAIKARRLAVLLQTNGTVVDGAAAMLLGSLLDRRVDLIQVSLDGATAATHDAVRGEGAFAAACQGIKHLVRTGIPLIVSCCPTCHNEAELPEIYETARALGAAAFQATPLAAFTPAQDVLAADPDTLFRAEAEVVLRAQRSGAHYLGGLSGELLHWVNHGTARQHLPRLRGGCPDRFRCGGAVTKIHITARGEVYPCVFAVHPTLCLGVAPATPLSRLWAARQGHPFVRGRSAPQAACTVCAWADLCQGGCPGLSLARLNTLDAADPRCGLGQAARPDFREGSAPPTAEGGHAGLGGE